MQVNLNCNCTKPQQNFGMAIHSNNVVNDIIKSRIKNKKQLNKLEQIFDNAKKNNKVDVNLMANSDGRTLSANIYSRIEDVRMFKSLSENIVSQMFGGGVVGFIEKCSKIADKAAVKVGLAKEIRDSKIFKEM